MSNAYDIVMDDRKKLVEKIIENMENGDLIFKKGWDVSVLRPQNPVSEVMYLGGNRLKLGIEAVINNYKDPRWVTYNQAKTNGWQVKKGEKGTRCEKWIFTKTVKEKDENGKIVEIEKKLDKPFPTYFTVFNAEQIEGIPPLELKNIDKEQSFIIAEKFIKSSECPIKEVAQEQAYYSPFDDEIVLPLRTAFRSEEAFLRTTLHEIGHSTGHKTRLNRDMSGAFGSENYAKEELVAELCSLFTQARLNIKLEGEHFNNHTAYLKSWIGALKNDPNELFRAATKAEAASERLYNNYLEKELLKEKNKKIEKNKIEEAVKSIDSSEKPLFRGLVIAYEYSERDLGIPDNTTLRGEEAYNFIKKLMEEDIRQYKIQQRIENGEDLPDPYYYKVNLSIQYKDYSTGRIRIDLGDLEFGGKEKVSDGLEHRLKLFPNEMLENKNQWAKMHNVTPGEIEVEAKKLITSIDKIMVTFRGHEKKLEEREKAKNKEMKKTSEKEKPKRQTRSRTKSKENER